MKEQNKVQEEKTEESKDQPKVNTEKVEAIKQIIRDVDMSYNNHSIIQDNKIHFNHEKGSYRCVMPNPRQQSEAEDIKNSFQRNNLGKYPTVSQYKKELKEKQDIDIDALQKKRVEAKEEVQARWLTLSGLLSNEPEEIESERVKLDQAKMKLLAIITEIEEYLSPCLEKKSSKKYNEYLAFLCTEKAIRDDSKEADKRTKWVPVWQDFNEFETQNTILANVAIANMQDLLLEVMR